MYAEGGLIMIIGVVMSLGFIMLSIWYVNRMMITSLTEKQWLTRFIVFLLTAFLALYIVDILISWKIDLISDKMSNNLFELIKTIVLIVFGYQFNAKKK